MVEHYKNCYHKKILYECQNLLLKHGTGIATYARNLVQEARSIGYDPSALVSLNTIDSKKQSPLNEVYLYDARKAELSSPIDHIKYFWRFLHAYPFGVDITKIAKTGIVIEPANMHFRENFDDIYASADLMSRAYMHFNRYGKLLPFTKPQGIDVFHATQITPLEMKNGLNISTIHDIIPLRLPYTTLDRKKYFYSLVKEICKKSDHIVTVSEHSGRDIIQFFGLDEKRITNTYQSVRIDDKVLSRTEDEIATINELEFQVEHKEYFIFLGAIEPKKNISRMIDAYIASGTNNPLLIIGGLGWQYEEDIRKIEKYYQDTSALSGKIFKREKKIRHIHYVSRRALFNLIRGAKALLFPSLYEGFGLPVLEAMTLGTPVITSNTSSLPELVGDAGIMIDPYDVESLAKAIRTIDNDTDLRAELQKKGIKRAEVFSPAQYQKRLSELYHKIL